MPDAPHVGLQYVSIVDANANPVWYATLPIAAGNVGDFEQQADGTFTVATDYAADLIPGADQTPTLYYQYSNLGETVRTWASPPTVGSTTILATGDHELRILADGTALLFGIFINWEDLSTTFDGGSADAGVYGSLMERLAPDGGVLFAWSSLTLPVTDLDPGFEAQGYGASHWVDAYHANAIDVMDDGNYLVSLRNDSEVVKVDSTTGDILWILGGRRSNFTFLNDPEGGFSAQHGVRELPNGHLILFDDGNFHTPQISRAVEYALDPNAMTATLVWQAVSSPPLFSYALGYAQRLANGNTVISYGTTHYVQEVAPDAGLVWELFDPNLDLGIYRAYRLDTLYPP
jgi:outer membrane protein assembly factor BamB